jgi:hypothetical protein
MAYTGNGYTTGDLTSIVSDGLGTAGAAIVGFMAIIIIVGLCVWGYRKMKRV